MTAPFPVKPGRLPGLPHVLSGHQVGEQRTTVDMRHAALYVG
jgi:hypothetical protein